MSELQRDQGAHWLCHDHAQGDSDGEFEISVESEQDHENQDDCQRADKVHLRFGFEELAIFASPLHAIALRQVHGLFDCLLSAAHGALKVAAFDAVLDADVTRVVLAINKGSAVALGYICELA